MRHAVPQGNIVGVHVVGGQLGGAVKGLEDVYKRQDEGCFPIHQEGAITVVRGFVAGNGDVSRVGKGQVPVEPVSYTHLDVYKRQVVAQCDMSAIYEVGLLKMDFLGLKP